MTVLLFTHLFTYTQQNHYKHLHTFLSSFSHFFLDVVRSSCWYLFSVFLHRFPWLRALLVWLIGNEVEWDIHTSSFVAAAASVQLSSLNSGIFSSRSNQVTPRIGPTCFLIFLLFFLNSYIKRVRFSANRFSVCWSFSFVPFRSDDRQTKKRLTIFSRVTNWRENTDSKGSIRRLCGEKKREIVKQEICFHRPE